MSLKFGGSSKSTAKPKIIVFGVGGGGCNAINHMIEQNIRGVDFVVANTDAQALEVSLCENKIQLGDSITGGLGAGSVPDIGRRSAEESIKEIEDYIRDANMVFIASGMGGGTGTGAAPIIAKVAKERGILTIGVVTKPFAFEREKRMKVAEQGIIEMRKYCDTTIVIANQNLFRIADAETTLTDAFKMADNVLVSGIRSITDLITNSGLINLDFADVSVIMSDMGYAVMGEGEGVGEDRAIRAAENAMTNPLLEESSIKGATGLLINITGGSDIKLFEINDIIDRITSEVDRDANIKFGSIITDDAGITPGSIKVSIVATGLAIGGERKSVNHKNASYESYESENTLDTKNNFLEKNTFNDDEESHQEYTPPFNSDVSEYEVENTQFSQYTDNTESNVVNMNNTQYGDFAEEDEDDYFKSFYKEKNGKTFEDIAIKKQQQYQSSAFIPKKPVSIQNPIANKPQGKQPQKFDFKNIFKINRGV